MALLPDLGPVDDGSLLADGDWLLPCLGKARTRADLRGLDLTEARAPAPAMTGCGPAGSGRAGAFAKHPWVGGSRSITTQRARGSSCRLQELFGVTRHPMVGNRPLRITMLSPGAKPIAVTTDLPGFWAGGYADARRDMRGRYPRHPWPEDPTEADPTLRAKPRGT
ncbi:ATP-dependent helicase C-terminal domain-containing protein [Paracoccus sp. DMF-8]|uniref:ATP-dependent helicase C-terminal domain-containing protein n=1 Tax=Paracoccus sp. DMF-8 TaxID=3019445 RepID=UPI0023E3A101|nr:ATP-dependent helicase C-terminal domain-containing protein [Paracoccus sp. DMF-8]MDF3607225.1 ATP-dependent helicase C-terminal domain-containing protein [Paracoccus sp. DMF-8]